MKRIGKGGRRRSEYPKTDLRYWMGVVLRAKYQDKGEVRQSESYAVRIGHAGTRSTFALGTPNKLAAAQKARDIYAFLQVNGWEAACVAFKKHTKRPCPVTVGELVIEARKVLDVRARTFVSYTNALRKIVSDMFGLEPGTSKYDYQSGGNAAWVAKVDDIRLEKITPKRIRQWRSQFLDRAKGDESRLRSARISATTFLREAKALFAPDVLKHFEGVKSPFETIPTGERVPTRYRSQVPDLTALVSDACRELNNDEHRECFKVFLLATLCGLRRSEIDLLEWDAFDFDKRQLRIQATRYFAGKSETSLGDIPLDEGMAELFRSFKTRTIRGDFVIASTRSPKVDPAYIYYRCQRTFDQLIEWLKAKGVTSRSPLHVLRKEFGSAMASKYGIFAASHALRHSSVAVTESHYATQKRTDSIGLGHLLTAPGNIVRFPAEKAQTPLDVQSGG
jgi:integrase